MGKYKLRVYQILLIFMDLVMVNIGFLLSFWIMFGLEIPMRNIEPYLRLMLWISLLSFLIFYVFDLYTNWRRKSLHHLIYSLIISVFAVALITMALSFWERGFAFPRSVILLSGGLQVLLLIFYRSVIWFLSKRLFGKRKVLIIDENVKNGINLLEKFLKHAQGWFIIHDFLSIEERHKLDEKAADADVILLGPGVNKELQAEIISYCSKEGKEVLIVPELFELFLLESELQQVDDLLVLSIRPPKLNPGQRMVKRTFDIVLSFLMLVLFSPIMLVLFILIKVTSPGPAIYKQERLCLGGKVYSIYKFRSMVQDAEKKTGPVLATDKDLRITHLGHFMRATRLDEIPQLINVLRGEMSLVGPRPERPFFCDQFKEFIPNYTYRLSVKPGITGLAQVMAKYSTTVEDKLRFDILYVRSYSFVLDLKILVQTIRVVLQRDQAKGVKEFNELDRQKIMNYISLPDIAETKHYLREDLR